MSSVFSSWGNLRRTPMQSLTATCAVFTTFFIVYTLTNLLYAGDRILHYFETQPEILVFFDVSVTDSEATADADLIAALDYVDSVEIIGKTQAFDNYQAANANEPLLLGLLSPDLFPASLSIKANSPEGLEKVRTELEKLNGIDEIDYHQDVVDEFLSWTHALRGATYLICIVFTIQFVLVIFVITSMKVVARRRTLNIMSVLGASRSMIRGTFVREAMWIGIVGSLSACGVSYVLFYYFQPQLAAFLGDINVFPLPTGYFILQAVIGQFIAAQMAALSAWLATNKLIKK